MRFLITGTAGFIGFHLARRLIADGHCVCGLDGMTPYYDVTLKEARHAVLARSDAFAAHVAMLEDFAALQRIAADFAPEIIVHLAAQAGVRYSLENPRAYVDANLVGMFNVMEIAKAAEVGHFLVASTSSVYGANTRIPFRETDKTDHPLTLYAATKKAGEDMAHSYAHLWKIPTTAFRFFTVYGPWGRPDMALFKFVQATLAGEPIDVFGNGRMRRDFTYVDDLVEAIVRLVQRPPREGEPVGDMDSLSPVAPLPCRQHRRRPAGRVARLHRRGGGEPRPAGAAAVPADAEGRRPRDLRLDRSPGAADRLQAVDGGRRRRESVRRMVS